MNRMPQTELLTDVNQQIVAMEQQIPNEYVLRPNLAPEAGIYNPKAEMAADDLRKFMTINESDLATNAVNRAVNTLTPRSNLMSEADVRGKANYMAVAMQYQQHQQDERRMREALLTDDQDDDDPKAKAAAKKRDKLKLAA